MNEQTIHIKSPISIDDLETMVSGLEIACGGNRIVVSPAFDLIVNDHRQVAALNALFGSNGNVEGVIVKHKTIKQSKTPNAYPALRAEMRAWQVLDILGMVTEQITISEKNRRLAAGEFAPDTILHHPKAGRQRVTGPQGLPQGLEPS